MRASGAVILSLLLAPVGCGGGGSHVDDLASVADLGSVDLASPPSTGSLTVTITSPAGSTPHITVSGPAGFSATLAVTQTLTDLAPGTYTVAADRIIMPGAVVSTVHDATITDAPADVTAGGAASVQVTFTQRAGTGKLWFSDSSNNALFAFDAGVLGTTGSPTPAVGLGVSSPSNLAFDDSGNLWFLQQLQNVIARLSPALLASNGTPTATATISVLPAYPLGLDFDPGGNLWIGNLAGVSAVAEYAVGGLGGTGTVTLSPTVTITNGGGAGFFISSLAHDTAGNLLVAYRKTGSAAGVIYSFTPAMVTTTSSPAPTKILNSTDLIQPTALAFDAHGNLWAANWAVAATPANLIRFDAALLTGTGTSSASSLVVTSSDLHDPNSLAFDESGNLWVTNSSSVTPTILRFAASELVGSGTTSLAANVILTTTAGGLAGLAFDPPPAGLPLRR